MFNTQRGFFYEPFKNVAVQPSNSSYGRWMVKTDEVTFRFFWKKAQAEQYAKDYNAKAATSIVATN